MHLTAEGASLYRTRSPRPNAAKYNQMRPIRPLPTPTTPHEEGGERQRAARYAPYSSAMGTWCVRVTSLPVREDSMMPVMSSSVAIPQRPSW